MPKVKDIKVQGQHAFKTFMLALCQKMMQNMLIIYTFFIVVDNAT
jgi:hypothetical protein